MLLLNTVLTVEGGRAHSHANLGWETFTDKVIAALNENREGVVFLLWGSHAQKKGNFIDRNRHHVLKAPHPSPLSAHRGFLGCRHFSQANQLLEQQGLTPIDWMPRLPQAWSETEKAPSGAFLYAVAGAITPWLWRPQPSQGAAGGRSAYSLSASPSSRGSAGDRRIPSCSSPDALPG